MVARARAEYELRAQDKTAGAFKSFNSRISRASKALTGFSKTVAGIGVVAGSAAAAGFVRLTSRMQDTASEIGQLNIRIGASVEALSEYRLVAERSGVSFKTFTLGLQRMTRRISEAARGTGEAKDALKELGFDAQKLNQLKPEQQFEKLANAFDRLNSTSDRVRLAMRLFDTEGVALLQTMEGGAEAIRNVRKEANRLGLTLDQETINAADKANDAITNLNKSVEGLAVTFTQSFSERQAFFFTVLTEEIVKTNNAFKEFKSLSGGELFDKSISTGLRTAAAAIPGPFGLPAARLLNTLEKSFQTEKLNQAITKLGNVGQTGLSAKVQSGSFIFGKDIKDIAGDPVQVEKNTDQVLEKIRDFFKAIDEQFLEFAGGRTEIQLFQLKKLTNDLKLIGLATQKLNTLNRLERSRDNLGEFHSLVGRLENVRLSRSGSGLQVSNSRFAFNDETTRVQDAGNRLLREIRDLLKRENEERVSVGDPPLGLL